MILILSELHDISTDKVTDWLNYYNVPYLRLDKEHCTNNIEHVLISNNNIEIIFKYKDQLYSLNDFNVIWCRRGFFSIIPPNPTIYFNKKIPIKVKYLFQRQLTEEGKTILDFIEYVILSKNNINNISNYNINKLIVLENAIKVGFKIPESYICKNGKNMPLKKEIITKAISNGFIFKNEKFSLDLSVKNITTEVIENKEFYFSLFQNKIKREIEIRVFIFQKEVFSMAIIPKDKNISDIRNSNEDTARMTPFNIPNNTKYKLIKLMKLCNLESASIDLIYDGEDFVFLELNPAGQFDYLSINCNYYIEKIIAFKLKNISII